MHAVVTFLIFDWTFHSNLLSAMVHIYLAQRCLYLASQTNLTLHNKKKTFVLQITYITYDIYDAFEDIFYDRNQLNRSGF